MEHYPKKYLAKAAILLVAVGVLHYIGQFYYLYWRLPWYDRLVHFLGGAFIVMVFISFFSFVPWKRLLPFLLVIIIIVGVAWEYFEFYTGITDFSEADYLLNSVYDILFSLIGAFTAVLYIKKHRYENR